MKIWIEVELHSDWYNSDNILYKEGLSYEKFALIEGTDIWVKLSREYYSSTIEYNFTPFENNEENFWVVVKYLNDQIAKYGLVMNDRDPRYVWTHIHIFTKEYFSLSYDTLLKVTLQYIMDNLDSLSDKSITRLAKAHQLWTYWSHSNWWEWYKAFKKYWIRPQYYAHHCDTKKYSPIFSSRATKAGKPRSLEIRCIPNEFIFNWMAYKMMKEIEAGTFLNRGKLKVWTFVDKCFDKLWVEKINNNQSSRWMSFDTSTVYKVEYDENLCDRLNSYLTDTLFTFWKYEWELIIYKGWEPMWHLRNIDITSQFIYEMRYIKWREAYELYNIFKQCLSDFKAWKQILLNSLRINFITNED